MEEKEVTITFKLRPDLAARLPKDAAERRELLNSAIENQLNGKTVYDVARKAGSMKTAKKAASSRENGKKGGRPRKIKMAD